MGDFHLRGTETSGSPLPPWRELGNSVVYRAGRDGPFTGTCQRTRRRDSALLDTAGSFPGCRGVVGRGQHLGWAAAAALLPERHTALASHPKPLCLLSSGAKGTQGLCCAEALEAWQTGAAARCSPCCTRVRTAATGTL